MDKQRVRVISNCLIAVSVNKKLIVSEQLSTKGAQELPGEALLGLGTVPQKRAVQANCP